MSTLSPCVQRYLDKNPAIAAASSAEYKPAKKAKAKAKAAEEEYVEPEVEALPETGLEEDNGDTTEA